MHALSNISNSTCECQLAAGDAQTRIIYPRLPSDDLRGFVIDARERRMSVLAVMLYNCKIDYVFEWRRKLQTQTWLDHKLTMTRRAGEFVGTQHALYLPARERIYSIAQFERLLLGSG